MESVDPFAPPPEADLTFNPYEAPRAEIEALDLAEPKLEKLASGQRLINYAILTYFLALVLYVGGVVTTIRAAPGRPQELASVVIALGATAGLGYLASFGMAVVGFFRMGSGLGIHWFFRILMIPLMIVPLLNLVILLMMNSRATKQLRAAGYHVGFLGASGQR